MIASFSVILIFLMTATHVNTVHISQLVILSCCADGRCDPGVHWDRFIVMVMCPPTPPLHDCLHIVHITINRVLSRECAVKERADMLVSAR